MISSTLNIIVLSGVLILYSIRAGEHFLPWVWGFVLAINLVALGMDIAR